MNRKTLVVMLSAYVALAGPAMADPAPWWARTPDDPAARLDAVFAGKSDAWQLAGGDFDVARDDGLGADVLTVKAGRHLVLEGRTDYSGSQTYRARLRLRSDHDANPLARLQVATTAKPETAILVTLLAWRGANTINCTVNQNGHPFRHDPEAAATLDWDRQAASSLNYYLKAYEQILPGWDVSFRTQIEAAMARLPDLERKWLDLRVECRPGLVRVWLDDRLVTTKEAAGLDAQGRLQLVLSPGAQLAAFTVAPTSEPGRFQPIELTGYANARMLLGKESVDGASLPPAGVRVTVGDVPFVFPGINPEGNDHLDIGQSLFRQANQAGYFPAGPVPVGRWSGAIRRDPARIQVQMPFGFYDALYLVAAADEDDENIPLVSAMFYRPGAGFSETVEARVPLATAKSTDATPLPVRLSNGKRANLWLVKIPLDPATLTAFSDLDIMEIEFTKKVHQYRSYPDPISYGWHQGGAPSGVHIYAATLSHSPLVFAWEPDRFGHVWTTPEVPGYTATVTNRGAAELTGTLTVTTRSYDGTEATRQELAVQVAAGKSAPVKVAVPVKLNGYHDLVATLVIGDRTWTETRSFVRLAPDTRSPRWTEGKGAMFGYWSYHGGHHTPKADHHVRLMTMAGARQTVHYPRNVSPAMNEYLLKHWGRGQSTAYYVTPQPWAAEPNPDPAKMEELRASILKEATRWEEAIPEPLRPDCISFFAEHHISSRLTAGNWPEYWNGTPFVYTDEENQRLKMFFETSRLAAAIVRKEFPDRKVMIPWGDPGFVIPLLRAGYPKDLVDGSSVDTPGFERLPEMQLADNALHRLYETVAEYRQAGIEPYLQYCEGIFVPTEVGACTWREQMDIHNRWSLLSMAYGVKRFYSGWFAFDSGDYYGAEHYGGCGIQRRIPYCDPKPAYAAFATMTDKLNEANFDGWLPTGSRTTYCLRFKHETRGVIYALWTIRGTRPVTLTLAADATAQVTDAMNNTVDRPTANRMFTVTTDQSVIYVTGAGEVTAVSVGTPDHGDVQPADSAKQVADLGDGTWRYTAERHERYETNHWGFEPFAGAFTATVAEDPERGAILVSTLQKQDQVHELMPWYNTLRPAKPIALPYAPSHLGLWVRGASDWGRVIYVLIDAQGERWTSIGSKDNYNCNDVHSWSSFNFDGWRYLRFELPGHTGWDSFRKHGTTWWRADGGDDIVDLPLKLESLIVEQRTHLLYVNDVQPVASDAVAFGKLYVEYATPGDATADAVRDSKQRLPLPTGVPDLPNPIAALQRDGVGAPTRLLRLTPPEHYYDGTRMHVHFTEVPDAKQVRLWVGPYEDGRGAVNLVPTGIKNNQLVTGLRPGIKLYYWLTYLDADGKESKPSPVHLEVTVDNFKEK